MKGGSGAPAETGAPRRKVRFTSADIIKRAESPTQRRGVVALSIDEFGRFLRARNHRGYLGISVVRDFRAYFRIRFDKSSFMVSRYVSLVCRWRRY